MLSIIHVCSQLSRLVDLEKIKQKGFACSYNSNINLLISLCIEFSAILKLIIHLFKISLIFIARCLLNLKNDFLLITADPSGFTSGNLSKLPVLGGGGMYVVLILAAAVLVAVILMLAGRRIYHRCRMRYYYCTDK